VPGAGALPSDPNRTYRLLMSLGSLSNAALIDCPCFLRDAGPTVHRKEAHNELLRSHSIRMTIHEVRQHSESGDGPGCI
jgi:hypothetical protein